MVFQDEAYTYETPIQGFCFSRKSGMLIVREAAMVPATSVINIQASLFSSSERHVTYVLYHRSIRRKRHIFVHFLVRRNQNHTLCKEHNAGHCSSSWLPFRSLVSLRLVPSLFCQCPFPMFDFKADAFWFTHS